jgi:hypothetical protein
MSRDETDGRGRSEWGGNEKKRWEERERVRG